MREIKYKRILTAPCPYSSNFKNKRKVGGFYCKVSCKFNAIPLMSSKKTLCTADEKFEPNKKYKFLLLIEII